MTQQRFSKKFATYLGMLAIVTLIFGACTTLKPVSNAPESEPSSSESVSTEGDNEAATDEPEGVTQSEGSLAQEISGETYKDIPVGYTEEGYVYRGNPDAPVTMYEYSDYQCPFCQRHFNQTEPALDETYVQTGQLRVVFRDFPLTQIHPNAPAASASALCVAEQSPVAFWEMHGLLFETQNEWARLPEPYSYFTQLAAQLEIDLHDFETCVANGDKDAWVDASFAEGRGLGFTGTPSFQFVIESTGESFNLVGAQPFDRFVTWLDALVEGNAPPDAPSTPPDDGGTEGGDGQGQIPFWATAEGLAPDPDRPGYTVAGDQYRGDVDAPVVVIEYSDFQCPFCRRHVTDTQPILDTEFVDTGKVRWVFKHFPLNIHPQAPAAGVAAECAAEQGQFWEMHHLLFENMSAWSISDPNPVLTGLAEELALDMDAFSACLADESIAQRVDSDFADGRQFVRGTPTFIVMLGEQGRIIPGALPAESFSDALNEFLSSAQ